MATATSRFRYVLILPSGQCGCCTVSLPCSFDDPATAIRLARRMMGL